MCEYCWIFFLTMAQHKFLQSLFQKFSPDFGDLVNKFFTCLKQHKMLHILLSKSQITLLPTFECPSQTACTHTPRSWCSQPVWPSWNWAGCHGKVQRSLHFLQSSSPSGSWAAVLSPRRKLRKEIKNRSNVETAKEYEKPLDSWQREIQCQGTMSVLSFNAKAFIRPWVITLAMAKVSPIKPFPHLIINNFSQSLEAIFEPMMRTIMSQAQIAVPNTTRRGHLRTAETS